jgi:hypothetical protein
MRTVFRMSLLAAVVIAIGAVMVQHQSFAQTIEPKGTAVNSKYLTIKDLRFGNEDSKSYPTITGTIANNSTTEIRVAQVYAALYDKDNKLISVESGSVNVSDLKAGDNSPFKISLIALSSTDNVDHYTVMPGGLPTTCYSFIC